MNRIPALVIGGGPAGSIAAIRLAQGGMRTLLVERSHEDHDPVCGGFVSADALQSLEQAGIAGDALGGHRIEKFRVVVGERSIETRLPFPAIGLSRRKLDAILIEAARTAGARIVHGLAARELDAEDRSVSFADGSRIAADAVLLATGKLNLRGADRPGDPDHGDAMVGLRIALRPGPGCIAALAGTIELHPFEGGYCGLVLQEDRTLNLCLSVAAKRLRAVGGSADALLAALAQNAPTLARRVEGGRPVDGWRSIARIPYGWRAPDTEPGIFRIGDQAAVIASLAGDGIAIAIASATAASKALLRDGPAAAPAYQRAFAARARWPLAVGEMLRAAAERPAWSRPVSRLLQLHPRALAWGASLTRISATA
jgi:flavin-dependent dehydrogenase